MSIVGNEEILARVIQSEGGENQSSGQVKGEAFLPLKRKRFETSVIRHDGSSQKAVIEKGKKWKKLKRKKPVKFLGWADVTAGAVRTISHIPALDVEGDVNNKKNLGHANIVGWDLDFGKQMLQAEDIATQSQFCPA